MTEQNPGHAARFRQQFADDIPNWPTGVPFPIYFEGGIESILKTPYGDIIDVTDWSIPDRGILVYGIALLKASRQLPANEAMEDALWQCTAALEDVIERNSE